MTTTMRMTKITTILITSKMMSEQQLNEIRATWELACDSGNPECVAAISKLLHTDMPALISYASVEVHNQTLLKMEVLKRIMELSEHYKRIDDAPVRTDTTVHATLLGG